jgi:signal transduction histidine kinase
MSEQSVCRRCGHAGPAGAHYCAHCGRALVPLRTRLATIANRSLDDLSPRRVGLLSLLALVLISVLAEYLIFSAGLHFSLSYVLLILIIGLGSAYLGRLWGPPSSGRKTLMRLLGLSIAMALLLAAVLLIDKALLSSLAASGRRVMLDIPGMHIEAFSSDGLTPTVRRIVYNRLPYWLFALVYALLVALASNLTHRLYTALRTREREIRDLRENLVARTRDAAVQQERNRLARELHDSIKQQIFSIGMGTAAVEARWDTDPRGAREALADVRRSSQEAMAEMNALLQQLSPAPLEKVGLVQALRDQCEALGYRTDAEVAVQFGELPSDDRLPAGAQESIFRVAQEAFSNVARHARAGHVRLYLGQREPGGPLTLEIHDDGQGFEVGEAEGGMGLENIRQRVSALGGQLALESAPSRGTMLRVDIPLGELAASPREALQAHALNKVFVAGLAGGLALIGVLFYPLYVLVPGRTVAGWTPGSAVAGLLLEIVALLLAGGAGLVAARWAGARTRWSGTLFGAVAGGVAGAVLFFGLGAPATAVVGGAALLERGLVPAAGRADVIRLLAGAAVGTVGWSHAAFWAALLTGTGLGAIGGLLAPPTAGPSRRPDLRLAAQMILTAVVLVSALCVLVAVSRFALLEPTIREGLVVNGLSLETTLPLERVSDWLIGTPLAFYLTSLVGGILLLRAEIKQAEDPVRVAIARATALLLALASFGAPVVLGVIGYPLLPRAGTVLPRGWLDITGLGHPGPASIGDAIGAPLLLTGLAGSVVMGSLYLAAAAAARRRQRAMASHTTVRAGLRLVLSQSIGAGLGFIIALAVPPMTTISTVVGMGLVTNQLVEVLVGSGSAAQEFTLVELVRSVYLNQASGFLTAFVVAVAAVGLLALLVSGITALSERSET